MILPGSHGGRVDRVPFRQPATVRQREHLAVRLAPLGPAVEQDAATLASGALENAHCGTFTG